MSGAAEGGPDAGVRALLCVPNVSEGRDVRRVDELAAAIRADGGVRLLHRSSDPDHHRTVFAYLGPPEEVLRATRRLAERTFELVDMREHEGEHPRLGALDVVPFVPVRGVEGEEALAICRRFGRWVGERGVPVYYYEEAATRPERRDLPAVRRGQYEGLEARLGTPAGRPDEGPAAFVPRTGAVIAGVRGPLVAFNVNLRGSDLEAAREVARAVRESGDGLPHVRAIAVPLRRRGLVQVSMNLVRPDEVPPGRALEAVRAEAARRGLEVAGTEVVGVVPLDVVAGGFAERLGIEGFEARQIVELGLIEGWKA